MMPGSFEEKGAIRGIKKFLYLHDHSVITALMLSYSISRSVSKKYHHTSSLSSGARYMPSPSLIP